jgi:guanylate kinase
MNKEEMFDLLHPQPLLIVISGPSGVGKDSVLQGLKRRNLPFHFVVTATSRAPRSDEVNGRDLYLYSRAEFEERCARGEFIEHALVYQDLKGIPCCQIEDAIKSGKDVVLRVDVQGAATIRNKYPQAVMIFLIPRCYEEWYQRLINRKTESEEQLKIRIEMAAREVEQIGMFDYIVVNAENLLEQAVDDIISIIRAEHLAVNHRVLIK